MNIYKAIVMENRWLIRVRVKIGCNCKGGVQGSFEGEGTVLYLIMVMVTQIYRCVKIQRTVCKIYFILQ